MNPGRIAAIVRQIGALFGELADALDADVAADSPAPSANQPAPKRRLRRPPSLVRPPGEADPSIAQRAARILKERGFR